MKSIRDILIQNSFWNFVSFVFSLIVSFITVPIVVNKLGVEYFGIYGLITGMLAPLCLANLGFGEATIKYVAQYAHKGNPDKVRKYIATTYMMNGVVGIVGCLIIILVDKSDKLFLDTKRESDFYKSRR